MTEELYFSYGKKCTCGKDQWNPSTSPPWTLKCYNCSAEYTQTQFKNLQGV